MFEGLILFTHNQHGWRIDYVQERPVLFTRVAVWGKGVSLCVLGHFHKKPRRGLYCKRPHKLIAQYH